jgi:hypothetical protein
MNHKGETPEDDAAILREIEARFPKPEVGGQPEADLQLSLLSPEDHTALMIIARETQENPVDPADIEQILIRT